MIKQCSNSNKAVKEENYKENISQVSNRKESWGKDFEKGKRERGTERETEREGKKGIQ